MIQSLKTCLLSRISVTIIDRKMHQITLQIHRRVNPNNKTHHRSDSIASELARGRRSRRDGVSGREKLVFGLIFGDFRDSLIENACFESEKRICTPENNFL